MNYPFLGNVPGKSTLLTAFGGYVHGDNAGQASFFDMAELTADKYPLLSVRAPRAKWSVSPVSGIFGENGDILPGEPVVSAAEANGRIVFCTRTRVFADGQELPDVQLPDGEHRIATFGRNFFVYPDGLYIEKKDTGGFTVKRTKYNVLYENVTVKICGEDGTLFAFDGYGAVLPEAPAQDERFLLTGDRVSYLYTYHDGWNDGEKAYIGLEKTGIGLNAYVGETLKLRGILLDKELVSVHSRLANSLTADIRCRIPSLLLIHGGQLLYGAIRLCKDTPVLDLVCERNNRLWGCRYGDDGSGNFVNELYACAQGDPTDWESLEGISTDSFRASLGCPGAFTGACALSGEMLFFKEDCIVRVSGGTPADFYVTSFPARGVEAGAENTLVLLNEKAFYKSASGVTVYDGALTTCISDDLGELSYESVCAGSENAKYYLKIRENGENALLVYDTKTGAWYRERDNENIRFFVKLSGRLFTICENGGTYSVWSAAAPHGAAFDVFRFTPPTGAEYTYIEEEPCRWFAVTGNMCAKYAGTKYIRSMSFRISAAEESEFSVAVRCNDEPFFREICTLNRVRPGLVTLRVNVPRCESFSMKLSGKGACTVHSVNVITQTASEVSTHG